MQAPFSKVNKKEIQIVTCSLQGDRSNQEDAFSIVEFDGGQLYVVCDGLGGMGGGEIASEAFTSLCSLYVKNYGAKLAAPKILDDFLETITERFKQKIIEKNEEDANTTLALAIVLENCWISIHIGDSRIYQFRQNHLYFRTKDHSYLQSLLDEGKLTEEQAKGHPQQNILNRSMGMYQQLFDIQYHPKLKKNDTLLLATDGFWQAIDIDEMVSVCLDPNTLSHLCDAAYGRGKGRSDNITAIVAKYG